MVEKENTPLQRIGRGLRERVEKIKEYQPEDEKTFPYFSFGIGSQQYVRAQELKQRLLEEYAGTRLVDVIDGEEYKSEKGTCYRIETQEKMRLTVLNQSHVRERLLSDLKLIYGIGEVTEGQLKSQGYKTIEDLVEHPRFGTEAAHFLAIDMCDTCQLIQWIGHWLPQSHPLVLYSSSFHPEEDFILVDIETMGLFSLPIILCGVAYMSGSHLVLNQYLLRDISEEPGALSGFLSHINGNSIFITFNGKAFDIPFIRERLVYYGIKADIQNPHFDMLHFSRRAWKERLPDCRLTTLEHYVFGVKRVEDVPSALVPQFYDTYNKTRNVGPLIPIVEHNRQDMITLAHIFSHLHEEWK